MSVELHPIKPSPKAWHMIGIDMIGPLPLTTQGNKHIITATCYFTKWAEAEAVPDKEATTVAEFLYKTFTRLGFCDVRISDQGREFVNQVNDELCRLSGITSRIATAYHPQTNGLDERFNQTLQRQLLKFVQSENEWDQYLDSILFSYRVSRQDTTKYTPFYLMYGRHAKLPIQFNTGHIVEEHTYVDDVIATDEDMKERNNAEWKNITEMGANQLEVEDDVEIVERTGSNDIELVEISGDTDEIKIDINDVDEEGTEENNLDDHEVYVRNTDEDNVSVSSGHEDSTSVDDEFTSNMTRMIRVRKEVMRNISNAQDRQKRQYDAKHQKDKLKYQVGTPVLLRNSKKLSRKGSKLEPNWIGPYKISAVLTKNTVKLSHMDSSKELASLVNVTRLKLYHIPSTQQSQISDVQHSKGPNTTTTQKDKSLQPCKPVSTCNLMNHQTINTQASTSTYKRYRGRCRQCIQCNAPDCGKCKYCLDKTKFGGPGKLKQCCVQRQCSNKGDKPIKKLKTAEFDDETIVNVGLTQNDTLIGHDVINSITCRSITSTNVELRETKTTSQDSNNKTPKPEESMTLEVFHEKTKKAFDTYICSDETTDIIVLQDIFSKGKIGLSVKDIMRICSGDWLSDKIINFYMFFLNCTQSHSPDSGRVTTYCLTTFFYEALVKDIKCENFIHCDLQFVRRLIIPIHLPYHWILVEVDLGKRVVRCLDPLGFIIHDEVLDNISYFLQHFYDVKYGKKRIVSKWKRVHDEQRQLQTNGSDCGLFICKYSQALTFSWSLSFNSDSSQLRIWLCQSILKSDSLCLLELKIPTLNWVNLKEALKFFFTFEEENTNNFKVWDTDSNSNLEYDSEPDSELEGVTESPLQSGDERDMNESEELVIATCARLSKTCTYSK